MRATGYGSYHGNSKLRAFLRGLLIALLVVIILAVAVFLLLQRYIVYSAEGPRLKLPFFQTEETAPPEPSAPQVSEPVVVIEPEPEPEPVVQPLRAVFLPREAMYDDTARGILEFTGAWAAIYDMKDNTGGLGYVSAQPLAIAAGVSLSDVAVGAAIRAYTSDMEYTVARVSCFKDHRLSDADRSLAVTTNSGYRWTDPENVRWVSPTSEAVRNYLTEVCVELARLGFDEILLDHATYPPEGNLGYIRAGSAYDKAAFEGIISGFYEQVKTALEPLGVKLSVMTDAATVLEGYNPRTGQSAAGLAKWADRVYLAAEDARELALCAAALELAGMEEVNLNLVDMGAAGAAGQQDSETAWAAVVTQEDS